MKKVALLFKVMLLLLLPVAGGMAPQWVADERREKCWRDAVLPRDLFFHQRCYDNIDIFKMHFLFSKSSQSSVDGENTVIIH